jgi:xanthine dehydrogenase accessory factor
LLNEEFWRIGFVPRLFIEQGKEVRLPRFYDEELGSALYQLTPEFLKAREAAVFSLSLGNERMVELFAEPVRARCRLFIFGAGHVSRQIAPLAGIVGFDIFVIDDRELFADKRYFPEGTVVSCLAYRDVMGGIRPDRSSFIVIVTRGHLGDETVLAQALETEACYIGMIGSTRKRDAIFMRLREKGFSEEDLARVHCPIGIEIGAETPHEIAVSIVAELIRVRAALKLL